MLKGRWFWPLLGGTWLVVAAICARQAPCGVWRNQALSVQFWGSCDPGGAYFGSAAHFFGPGRYLPFSGHPGVPLQFVLWVVMQLAYGIYQLCGGSAEFPDFIARNIFEMYTACSVVVAAVHLLSFVLLERVALRFLNDTSTARLSVLGYATSFPALYYIVRISVEPFIVLFFLVSVLAVWHAQELLRRDHRRSATKYICLAGLSTAAGFLTKMHLLGFLPLYIFIQLLCDVSTNDSDRSTPRQRVNLATWFSVSFLIFLVLGGFKVDWMAYYKLWSGIVREESSLGTHPAVTVSEVVSQGFLILATEGIFVLTSLYGLCSYWKKNVALHSKVLWATGYAVLLVAPILLRGQFHYLFVPIAVLAIFFGPGVRQLATRVSTRTEIAIVLTIFIHTLAGWAFYDSKQYDKFAFRQLYRPYQYALERTRPSERVALVMKPNDTPLDPFMIHGMYSSFVPETLPVPKAFHDLFMVIYAGPEIKLGPPQEAQFRASNIGVVIDQRSDELRVFRREKLLEPSK